MLLAFKEMLIVASRMSIVLYMQQTFEKIDKSYADLPHILIVDDDDRIRKLLYRFLSEYEFVLAMAKDAYQAEEMLKASLFDCLIVDVMMPGKTGVEFVRDIRANGDDVPVLMLTALGEVDDRISGLEAGVDDYLPKPFEPRELLLRLQAMLKRRALVSAPAELCVGPWVFDEDRMELVDNEKGVREKLTVVESRLLCELLKRKNQVINRNDLAESCGVDPDGRTIDVQVARLRRKLEIDPKDPRYLMTIRGQGYVLRVG